ncbi:MAG: PKD domain-containing protein, partial [Bacteroidetes bacterium]|nr:PKD domain-containing protein [Bacteroidota bacterium]
LGNIYCGHTLIRSTSANTPAYFNSDSVLTLDYIELLYIHSANPQNIPDTAVRSLDDGGNYFWNFHLVYTAIEQGSTTTSPVHPCFGDGSGEITFNPQGGVPPYEYSILDWNNIFHIFTSWTPFQTSNVFNSLPGLYAVNYPVRIVDQFGCLFTTYVQVGSPPDIVLTDTNITHVSCYRYKDGEISIQGQGGTGPLLYALNEGNFDSITFFPDLDTGLYYIHVKDSVLCERVFGPYRIIEPALLTAHDDNVDQTLNCSGDTTASILIDASGGTPPYSYTFVGPYDSPPYISDTVTSTNPLLLNLHGGKYKVIVTDQHGCTTTVITSRWEPPPLLMTAVTGSTNDCADTMHFKVVINVTGGSDTYVNYWFFNNAGIQLYTGPSNTIQGLSPGDYSAVVLDSRGCKDTLFFTIRVLESNITGSHIKNCRGSNDNDGWACVEGLYGSGSFTYLWSQGSPISCAIGLDTGWYYVIVTDALMHCKVHDSVYIGQPDSALTATLYSDSTGCQGSNDGSAWVVPSGGTPPYTYNWVWYGSPSITDPTNDTITTLSAGLYFVTVTDSLKCTFTGSIWVNSPPNGIVHFTISWGCTYETYMAQVNVIGGAQPFTYSWTPDLSSTSMLTGPPDTYTVVVTDRNHCTFEGTITLEEFKANLEVHSAHCKGDSLGWATANPTGGNPGLYQYQWFQLGNPVFISNNDTLLGFPAGDYGLKLTDHHGCADSIPFKIDESANPLTLTVSSSSIYNKCSSDHEGFAVATAQYGTPPHLFNWQPGDSITSFITHLGAGTYYVTLTDGAGCIINDSAIITAPPPIIIDSIHIDSLKCDQPDSTGGATIYASGGTPNLEYRKDGGPWQLSNHFPGLTKGPHNLEVKDHNQCIIATIIDIPAPPPLVVTLVPAPPSGFGIYDGSVSAIVTGGIPPYTYLWSNNAITSSISGLGSGIFCLTVTDHHGCVEKPCLALSSPGELLLAYSSQDINCHGDFTGSIDAVASGGVPPYAFSWSPVTSPPPAVTADQLIWNTLPAGVYNINVTDFNNISTSLIITLGEPTQPFQLNLVYADFICPGTNPPAGKITANLSGNTPPYYYSWYGGSGINTESIYDSLQAGHYTVTIKDSKGCEISDEADIGLYTKPVANISVTFVCQGISTILTDQSFATGTTLDSGFIYWGDTQHTNYLYPPDPPRTLSHLYQFADIHPVKFLVKDHHECYSDTLESSAVVLSSPTAAFVYDSACLGGVIHLIDTSLNNGNTITLRKWIVGDQTVINTPFYNWDADQQGISDMKLIVQNALACKDSVTHQLVVDSLPFPYFTYTDSICERGMVRFTDTSEPNGSAVAGWFWKFGDGNSSSNQNPIHSYLQVNTSYEVTLIATSQRGCSDSLKKQVYVSPPFTMRMDADTVCFGTSTPFRGTILYPPGDSWVYQYWYFGDGHTAFVPFPGTDSTPHTFLAQGTYISILLGQDAFGCEDLAFDSLVVVDPLPEADFTYHVFCDEQPVSFHSTYSPSGQGLTTYRWTFNGNTLITYQPDTFYLFPGPGSYPVQLIVTDGSGCSDTITRIIAIDSLPTAGFKADTACLGTATHFTDLSHPNPLSWYWDFGDPLSQTGNHDTLQHPAHVFTGTGPYPVKLVITNQNNCKDSITSPVIVLTRPVAAFTTDPATHCWRDTMQFSDQSAASPGTINNRQWDFGDPLSGYANYSGQPDPGHHFTHVGGFTVNLIVQSIPGKGCLDTASLVVQVKPHPIADFSFNTSCLGDTTYLVDQSQAVNDSIIGYYWGYPPFPISKDFALILPYSGDTLILHAVENSDQCTDTVIIPVTVLPLPHASFSHAPLCVNNPIQFQDHSDPVTGTITNWEWDFGDVISGFNNYSTLQNPEHQYVITGDYIVRLIVITDLGCRDTVYDTLTILPTPTADFIAGDACLGKPTQFTDMSSSLSGDISTWSWDFGNATYSDQQNPIVYYGNSGYYYVTLEVTDEVQCKGSITKNVPVRALPVPAFYTDISCSGNTVFFFDQSNGAGYDITNWYWTFGDPYCAPPPENCHSDQQDPEHIYNNAGTYDVTLTVTNSKSCENNLTQTIYVPEGAVADFSWEDSLNCIGLSFQFFDESYAIGSTIISRFWDFHDGTTSTMTDPLHVFYSTGPHEVTLFITTSTGCTKHITKTVIIFPLPFVEISYTGVQCLGNPTQFYSVVSGSGQQIQNYLWNFGDPGPGNIDTQPNPIHTYLTSNTFHVVITVVDTNKCPNSYQLSVPVYPKPDVDFTIIQPVCHSDSSCFIDETNYHGSVPLQWTWNFGEVPPGLNNTSDLQNPCHFYTTNGSYNVKLSVINTYGCKDDTTMSIVSQMGTGPVAAFTVDPTTLCFGDLTRFFDQTVISGAGIQFYQWDFDDPGSPEPASTLKNPAHKFLGYGDHAVTLTVTDSNFCQSTITQLIQIKPTPVTGFSYDIPSCQQEPVTFRDTSITSTQITDRVWTVNGVVQGSDSASMVYTFNSTGAYTIGLQVTSEAGCDSSASHILMINTRPTAQFSVSPDTVVCHGGELTFTSSSSPGTGDIIQRRWFFGDSQSWSSSAGNSISKEFFNTGSAPVTIEIRLAVENSEGCWDTISKEIIIRPLPLPDFIFPDTTCDHDSIQFAGSSTLPNNSAILTWNWYFDDPVNTYGTGDTVKHQFSALSPQPWIYDVKLTVFDGFCANDTTKPVTIFPLPQARFTFDTACRGNPTHFEYQPVTFNAMITSWLWSFDTIYIPNPSYIFPDSGSFPVTLTIYDTNNCHGEFTRWVAVDSLPFPSFTWHDTCVTGTSAGLIHFEDLSLPNGSPVTGWIWQIDTTTLINIQNPLYTFYTFNQSYKVTLTAISKRGCRDSISDTIFVRPPFSVDFHFADTCDGDSARFVPVLLSPGPIHPWEWHFGDTTWLISSLDTVNHLYPDPGYYYITLIGRDFQGCIDSIGHLMSVFPLPEPDFRDSIPHFCNDTARFVNLTLPGPDSILSYHWDFDDPMSGNDNFSSLRSPKHKFFSNLEHTYLVTLTVFSLDSCDKSITHPIYHGPCMGGGILPHDTSGCTADLFYFYDNSTIAGSPDSVHYFWNFGDPASNLLNTDTHKNTFHLYQYPDTYVITHTTTAYYPNFTLTDVVTDTISIYWSPVAQFSFGDTCFGNPVVFVNNSSIEDGSNLSCIWNFGPGALNGQPNNCNPPPVNYGSYGAKPVTLIVVSDKNCPDTANDTVQIFPAPVAQYSVEPDSSCRAPDTVNFTDHSTIGGGGNIVSYIYSFGEGNPVTFPTGNVQYIYYEYGLFLTSLKVVSDHDCPSSVIDNHLIRVNKPPVVDFSHTPEKITVGDPSVQFNLISNSPILYCNWDLGDGGVGSHPQNNCNPTYSYDIP